MKTLLIRLLLPWIGFAGAVHAATDVRVTFTLTTADAYGAALTQTRNYFVYRPDGLPRGTPVPMVLVMEGGPATQFHRKADQAGFVVVSCTFDGNSLGTVWNNDDPRVTGFEDYDYCDAVIRRVALAENANDAFICGLSKGGHMAYAYACERPGMIRAASSVDEFMGLASNVPAAPVPIIAFQGTLDTNVPYTMSKDSVDAWRAMDGLLGVTPVTTYESAPLLPGRVTQATWRQAGGGPQVAFVTIVGGDHRWAVPGVQTGYDSTDGLWTFFAQFLTGAAGAPKIVAVPGNHTALRGNPASFWVAATGSAPLRYQWQRNGSDLAGATANGFTMPATTAADSGAAFRCVVSNAAGSVTSSAATLTVNATPADPAITVPPADQTVTAGRPVALAVTASGTAPLSYQWRKNGVVIVGATAASLALPAALTADAGALFTVVVGNAAGSVTSVGATLTVLPASGAPIILAHPGRARVLAGQTGTFAVSATSPTPLNYQWQQGTFTGNMADIAGANAATYTTPTTVVADHLTLFRCVVSNAAGSVTSASEMLFVTAVRTKPTDVTSATSAFAQPGAPFAYTITSSGGTEPITYAASPLPAGLVLNAATGVIAGTPTTEEVTRITVTASNPAGSTSADLVLTVVSTPVNWGAVRLANLSTRGNAGPGDSNLIAGFVVQGNAPKSVLLRAVGPALAKFGVTGVLADPRFTLSNARGETVLAVDDWDARGEIPGVTQRVGAFALDAGSKDAAVVASLAAGAYTVRVEGADLGSGVVLIEVYDADPAGAASRLVNLSTRGIAGREGSQMIAGFVIEGSGDRAVLVRAIGGGTLSAFGLSGGLGDPALEIYTGAGELAGRNDDWQRSALAARLPQQFSSVGAFGLPAASKDAATVITLAPGAYTAKVVNLDQPAGVALIEIYQAP